MDRIKKNISAIRAKISATCNESGRNASEIILVAVSKTVGSAEISSAIACGIHNFGENRTSLLTLKQAEFPQENWHFIGSIQTNKIKDFVGKASLIHSVASSRALTAISKRADALEIKQQVLIEVNMSGELSKDGIKPTELEELLDYACELPAIKITGLMTMAAFGDKTAAQKSFEGLRVLRDRSAKNYNGEGNIQLVELSMGMSDDYTLAIIEGATILRIGRSVWQ